MRPFGFVVPGRLDQITGGYLYDRRVVEGLRAQGRAVAVHELPGRFPEADEMALEAAAALLAGLPDGAGLCIDGLALPGFSAMLAEHADRLALTVLVHHPLALETGLTAAQRAAYAALEARLLPLCRGVICPSPASAAAVGDYGVAPERIAVVPPGLDRAERLAQPRETGPVRLLSVATVTPRKGHVLLVEALAPLAALPWHLTIIGSLERDAVTVERLRAAIAEGSLGDRVTLAGEAAPGSLGAAYAEADLFVLASYHEGYGMVFAEAMARGLPILATTGGAIPQTVPPSAGLLVPPGDRAALTGALKRLLGDVSLRRQLGRGALAAAAKLPDWDRTSRTFGAALDRLCTKP
ncbi:MAG: glycosyltransferase family 4 protein [Aliidongia sp.]